MNKTVKNLINKTIELEYFQLDGDMTNLKKFEDYSELSDKYSELESKVYETLPKEYHNLIDDLTDMLNLVSATENKYMFKQGVIKGLTELNYLNDDIGIEVAFI